MNKRISSAGCLGLLFSFALLLCAQNPDELLAVRLPATQGYINRHATLLPLSPGRARTGTTIDPKNRPLRSNGVMQGDGAIGRRKTVDDRPVRQEVVPPARRQKPRDPLVR